MVTCISVHMNKYLIEKENITVVFVGLAIRHLGSFLHDAYSAEYNIASLMLSVCN